MEEVQSCLGIKVQAYIKEGEGGRRQGEGIRGEEGGRERGGRGKEGWREFR